MNANASASKVWLVTGCSTGIGRVLCEVLLEAGYRVAASARRLDDLADLGGKTPSDRLLRLTLDVTSPEQLDRAVDACLQHFGQIDVLVNNAGYGYLGAIEESDDADVRQMFEVNFWGLAAATRRVLPAMRERRSGCIVNISSVGGLRGAPGVGYYNATKFAVEGFSEALAQEVGPLGVHVLIVEPSGFRTDWAGRSIKQAAASFDDYAATAAKRAGQIRANSGNQPGDPVRAAQAIIKAVTSESPPQRLLLGRAAFTFGMQKVESLRNDFETWKDVSIGADFPASS